jgi:hypothetical protein
MRGDKRSQVKRLETAGQKHSELRRSVRDRLPKDFQGFNELHVVTIVSATFAL